MPFFKRRLSAIHGKLLFNGFASQALSTLEKISSAILQVSSSKSFKSFLGLVLTIGNRLNKNTSRGNAKGFDLRVLIKLSLVKSADRKTSLLRFIANFIDQYGIENGSDLSSSLWFEEIASISQATTVSFDNTAKVCVSNFLLFFASFFLIDYFLN